MVLQTQDFLYMLQKREKDRKNAPKKVLFIANGFIGQASQHEALTYFGQSFKHSFSTLF